MENKHLTSGFCQNMSNTSAESAQMNLETNVHCGSTNEVDKNDDFTFDDFFFKSDSTKFQCSKTETTQENFSNRQARESQLSPIEFQLFGQAKNPELEVRRDSPEQMDKFTTEINDVNFFAEKTQLPPMESQEIWQNSTIIDDANFSIDDLVNNQEAVLNGDVYKINVLPNGDIEFIKPQTVEISKSQSASTTSTSMYSYCQINSDVKENYSVSSTRVVTQPLPIQNEELNYQLHCKEEELKSFQDCNTLATQANVPVQTPNNFCFTVLDEKASVPVKSDFCEIVKEVKPVNEPEKLLMNCKNPINKFAGQVSKKAEFSSHLMKVMCQNCRKKIHQTEYDEHLKNCLNRKNLYPCSYQNCEAVLASPYNLRRHEKKVHNKSPMEHPRKNSGILVKPVQSGRQLIRQHFEHEKYNASNLTESKIEDPEQEDSSESIDISFLYEKIESPKTKEIRRSPPKLISNESSMVSNTDQLTQKDPSAVFLYQVVLSANGEPEYFRPLTNGEPGAWQKVFVTVDTVNIDCQTNKINQMTEICEDSPLAVVNPHKVPESIDMDTDCQNNNNVSQVGESCGDASSAAVDPPKVFEAVNNGNVGQIRYADAVNSLPTTSGVNKDQSMGFQGSVSDFRVGGPHQFRYFMQDESSSHFMDNELSEMAKEVSKSLVNITYPNSDSGSSISWLDEEIISDSESVTDYSTESPRSGQKVYPCDFKDCNALLSSLGNKRRHELFVHNPPVKCPLENCHKLVKPGGLDRHIRRIHEGVKQPIEKNILCPHENCNVAFATVACRNKHLNSVHQTPIKCPYQNCNVSVKPASLKRHILGLHGKVKKQCERCDASLSIYTFYNHIKKCGKK